MEMEVTWPGPDGSFACEWRGEEVEEEVKRWSGPSMPEQEGGASVGKYVAELNTKIHTLMSAGGGTTLRCLFPFSYLLTHPACTCGAGF
jgi:hypothetical protein